MKINLWRSLTLLLVCTGTACAGSAPGYKIVHGTLGKCTTMVAVPSKRNGNVLILAHGLRDPAGLITADFEIDSTTKTLLKEGWIIASTSYRRNGYIIDDAIVDVDDLRKYVIKTFGRPKRTILCGTSMGGAIVTLMAETHKGKYDGVLALGAALGANKYTYAPRMPLLFLCTKDEIAEQRAYVAAASKGSVTPALWHVNREGHCKFSQGELLNAIRGIATFCRTGRIATERNATVETPPPTSTAVFTNGSARAKITGIDQAYRNAGTTFVAADLARLGIKQGDRFTVRYKDQSVVVLFGKSYNDVANGEWVGFVTANGYLKIARNFASAAESLGCREGDELSISRASAPANAAP